MNLTNTELAQFLEGVAGIGDDDFSQLLSEAARRLRRIDERRAMTTDELRAVLDAHPEHDHSGSCE